MEQATSDELAEVISQPRHRPARDLRIDRYSPILHLFSTTALHRVLPDRVALALAALVGRLLWLWPPTRRRAIGRMSLILAGTHRAGKARSLARRQLIAHAVGTEFDLRPWMHLKASVEGRNHLLDAVRSGRPTIAMIAHLGWTASVALHDLGRPIYAIAHPFLDPDAPGYRAGWWAYKARVGWLVLGYTDFRLVFRGGSYRVLRAVLERAEIVMIAFDVPGSSRTVMAGKTAYVGSGIVNLAWDTDALIVPLMGHIGKRGASIRIHEPIDPRSFADGQHLLDRLAALVGEEIVRRPAQLDPSLFCRDLWPEDNEPYDVTLWARTRHVERLRRRAIGKLAYTRTQLAEALRNH